MRNSARKSRIIAYQIAGFSAILLISLTNEFLGMSQRLFNGGRYELNWQDAATEAAIELTVAAATIYATWKLLRRLYQLEEFLRVCSWCRKVGHDDEWVSFEEYLQRNLHAKTSHGICPECHDKMVERMRGGGLEPEV